MNRDLPDVAVPVPGPEPQQAIPVETPTCNTRSSSRRQIILGEDSWSEPPSGKHTTKLWKIIIFNGKIHYKWSFSIAMLNYH